ncbi:alpha/beta-hydrolase [Pluteus cervinus]|uniref:Alpha/beta-hydrolase n=1 Tax=Pluteus cervinus TaxID=181527 RepID=A0ACD3B4S4_9AGAR|nr:alpha/beta-hydrolase [Pluteus cervinus]
MFFWLLAVLASTAFRVSHADPVTVQIQKTTVQGLYNASTGIDSFRGVQYATSQRFKRAVLSTYSTKKTINATFFGVACPQIAGTNALAVNYGVYGTSEDCNILDVYRPHNPPSNQLLPVMLFLHGGALTQGAASYYPADGLVAQSSKLGLPVITVVINYRLAAYGFLGGKEAAAQGALNLGLYDQKAALTWVQNYIKNFGGDPSKVTVFGQSSGAMSISYHMLTKNQTLFRAAILESGTSTSVPVLPPNAYQGNYDALVGLTGCQSANNTFECLRTVDLSVMINATNILYGQPTLYSSRPWGVAIDGDVIPSSPSILTAQGKLSRIPIIAGNVFDEGTIFVKPQQLNSTDDLLSFLECDYLNRNATFFKNQTSISQLEKLYPDDPVLGSPYQTGVQTFFTGSQFKRAAALYGDLHFHSARRDFLQIAVSLNMPAWSYLFGETDPGSAAWQGVFHTSELPYLFTKVPAVGALTALSRQMIAYWVSFATNLDPNTHGQPKWEPYSQGKQNNYITAAQAVMVPDTFRKDGIDFIRIISNQFLEPKS